MTVYAVHPVNVNITDAARYGEVKYINLRYIYIDEFENGNFPYSFQSAMEKAANDFDHKTDYLLIAGDHIQLIAFTAILSRKYPFFRVLRFDRQENGYFPIRVPPLDT